MVNLHKFELCGGDESTSVIVRVINGKITKDIYRRALRLQRKFNNDWQAPYGISPIGLAYRCSCEHDCCGCLVRRHMCVGISNDSVIFVVTTTYNF